MERVMILVQHPWHVSSDEAESWLKDQLATLDDGSAEAVRLTRLSSPSSRFSQVWAWMIELDCRDAVAARDVVQEGAGQALLADLRLLGMRPSVALIEDAV